MISCVDDFAPSAALLSYRGNIRLFQEIFERLEGKVLRLGVSFSLAKTELINWRTPSQRRSRTASPPSRSKGSCSAPGTQNDG